MKSTPGFPDLCMVKNDRVIFAELKMPKGRISEAQKKWGEALMYAPGVEYYLWYPKDWDDIVNCLRQSVFSK